MLGFVSEKNSVKEQDQGSFDGINFHDLAVAKPQSTEYRRAKFNYQMFCQGCHAPDGVGYKSVPTLLNSVGSFLGSQEGREFLVRVPGSANSVLNDEDLAELLNWILLEFSDDSELKRKPYVAEEVNDYRSKPPLINVVSHRKNLIERLQKESQ